MIFIEPIRFASDKALEAMDNMNAEALCEKVALALDLSRQRNEKKKKRPGPER